MWFRSAGEATYRRKGTAQVNHLLYRSWEAMTQTLNFLPSEGDQEGSYGQSSEPLTIKDPLVINQNTLIFQNYL